MPMSKTAFWFQHFLQFLCKPWSPTKSHSLHDFFRLSFVSGNNSISDLSYWVWCLQGLLKDPFKGLGSSVAKQHALPDLFPSLSLSIFRESRLLFLLHLLLSFWRLHTSGRRHASLSAAFCFFGQRPLWLDPCCGSWSRRRFDFASAAPDRPAVSPAAAPRRRYSAPTCSGPEGKVTSKCQVFAFKSQVLGIVSCTGLHVLFTECIAIFDPLTAICTSFAPKPFFYKIIV